MRKGKGSVKSRVEEKIVRYDADAPHSQHRFLAPSSKLCQIYLRHGRGTLYLRAAVQRRGQRSPKGSGTNMTVEANLAPKHARKHETHPPRVKKKEKSSVSIQTIVVLFVLVQTQCWRL